MRLTVPRMSTVCGTARSTVLPAGRISARLSAPGRGPSGRPGCGPGPDDSDAVRASATYTVS